MHGKSGGDAGLGAGGGGDGGGGKGGGGGGAEGEGQPGPVVASASYKIAPVFNLMAVSSSALVLLLILFVSAVASPSDPRTMVTWSCSAPVSVISNMIAS